VAARRCEFAAPRPPRRLVARGATEGKAGNTQTESIMLVLTILVTIFLFGYLLAALLRPEWF
jgi:K+-transporting ATPase KdpF subunit